ncbi:DUF1015 domain-containing protein [Litoribacter ruber]|uniref:DUF1015 domain-containing protein n=1 Tax=Litoribacter ruber TaxID=702568 RepID=A0AAP2G3L0_9BACT|nr:MULTISPECIES: DUF1015 domain-containing protein [Litoribacter]MBS9523131.1 DUF1015 domain-containing protein [Litoribacter alkaliphilus]MBT0810706.1 DUF1015 domain-containing protein [Litoribacter ruber]
MAEILPIKAWRYNPGLSSQIEELSSPLFDVVSPKQREALYKNPHNSIHLSVPKGENPAQQAKATLEVWKSTGVIQQDRIPGIYVYYQYFRLPGQDRDMCRKGFIINVKAYDWDENVILRHENTIAKAVNDRIELLKETGFQSSPTHGLYRDPDHVLEKYMDQAVADPLYDIEDYQGVREKLGVIHDARIISEFLQTLRDKKIILADGHHRYEGALSYRKEMMANNPAHTGKEAYNYHMMYLTNAETKDLRILPTHRVFQNLKISEEEILSRLENDFIIKTLNDPQEIEELILHKQWAFGLIFPESAYKIRLKPEKFMEFNHNLPDAVKHLDLSILHYFFIERILGIPMEKQRFSDNIDYERNLSRCHLKVSKGEANFAVITKEISMKEVIAVCESGSVMPQKSTYFYPKALSGLIFGSVLQDDFEFPYELFENHVNTISSH